MNIINIILWVVVIAVAASLYAWYAAIVIRRNRVAEALAGIDVQLTQRHDLIPNVLAIAKRFMAHERNLMNEITQLRASAIQAVGEKDFARIGDKFAQEQKLAAGLGRLLAVAENYPALKSEAPMLEAQRSYREVETNIAAARRFYNSTVGDLRNIIQIFPGPLLAALAGVGTPPPFFETAEGSRAPVDAAALLG